MGPDILEEGSVAWVECGVDRLLGRSLEDSESRYSPATWGLPSVPRAGYNQLASTLNDQFPSPLLTPPHILY